MKRSVNSLYPPPPSLGDLTAGTSQGYPGRRQWSRQEQLHAQVIHSEKEKTKYSNFEEVILGNFRFERAVLNCIFFYFKRSEILCTGPYPDNSYSLHYFLTLIIN